MSVDGWGIYYGESDPDPNEYESRNGPPMRRLRMPVGVDIHATGRECQTRKDSQGATVASGRRSEVTCEECIAAQEVET